MNKITIGDLISLFMYSSQIQIHFINEKIIYQFDTFNLPYEFFDVGILSIKPPEIGKESVPLRINVDELLWFSNIKKIKKKFKKFEVQL